MMARSDFLAIAIIVAAMVLVVTCQEEKPRKHVSKCWTCASDAKDSEFCNDPFDETKLTDVQKSVFFVDCPAPPNRKSPQTNQQTVCRKLKQIKNDTVVIDRKCFWQEIDKPKPCENENLPDYIKVVSCELCDDIDGCNHSSRIAIQFGQIVAIMAIPLAIANSLSF